MTDASRSQPASPAPRRPKAGSWLDVSANKILTALDTEFGLVGLNGDETYSAIVAALTERRDAISQQMGMSASSAQRYFDDEVLTEIAAAIASTIAGEKPGTDPFGDTDTIPIDVSAWARAALSFQLAARALQETNPEFAWSLVKISASVTTIIVAQATDTALGKQLAAPVAGARYTLRIIGETAELVKEHRCGIDGIDAKQLWMGLLIDAGKITEALEGA